MTSKYLRVVGKISQIFLMKVSCQVGIDVVGSYLVVSKLPKLVFPGQDKGVKQGFQNCITVPCLPSKVAKVRA